MKTRIGKDEYYLNIAESASERGTCLRRNYGAIIVNNDEIISTGYVGAPRNRTNCSDRQFCIREQLNVTRGTRYELCRSVHSEANAIISASRDKMLGGTMYLCGKDAKTDEYVPGAEPCSMCKRLIINAGIEKVIIRDSKNEYRVIQVDDWIQNDESLEGKDTY